MLTLDDVGRRQQLQAGAFGSRAATADEQLKESRTPEQPTSETLKECDVVKKDRGRAYQRRAGGQFHRGSIGRAGDFSQDTPTGRAGDIHP